MNYPYTTGWTPVFTDTKIIHDVMKDAVVQYDCEDEEDSNLIYVSTCRIWWPGDDVMMTFNVDAWVYEAGSYDPVSIPWTHEHYEKLREINERSNSQVVSRLFWRNLLGNSWEGYNQYLWDHTPWGEPLPDDEEEHDLI